MPKKTLPSVSKKKVTKTPIFTMPKPIYLILGSFVIGLGLIQVGLMTKQAHEDHLLLEDRLRFMAVEREVNTLAQQLNAAKINDTQWIVKSFCTEGNVKFEEGDIRCGTSIEAFIPIENIKQVNRLIAETYNVLYSNSEIVENANQKKESKEYFKNLKPGFYATNHRLKSTYIGCSASFHIYQTQPNTLSMNFGCDDHARDFYFPRDDL